MAYTNPVKMTRTNTTNKIDYDVLNDDATLLADIKALFPTFPTTPIGMEVKVFFEGGTESQVKFNGDRWNDFINGNRYDTGGAKLIKNVLLSKSGTEYTVCITFK